MRLKAMMGTIFTIGHSTHTLGDFITLFNINNVTAICDVRSIPYSRINTQFNREKFKQSMSQCGIAYVFLGTELGARSNDPSCYKHGRVQYELLSKTSMFRQGLNRVLEGVQKYRVALMCAEKDPIDCHRAILISRHVEAMGVKVQHIHADGCLEPHAAVINRLVLQLGLLNHDMFRSHRDVIAQAYQVQEERIAYRPRGTGFKDTSNVTGAVR